jgi:hypothetical protein
MPDHLSAQLEKHPQHLMRTLHFLLKHHDVTVLPGNEGLGPRHIRIGLRQIPFRRGPLHDRPADIRSDAASGTIDPRSTRRYAMLA